jgi:hypothetical protein
MAALPPPADILNTALRQLDTWPVTPDSDSAKVIITKEEVCTKEHVLYCFDVLRNALDPDIDLIEPEFLDDK